MTAQSYAAFINHHLDHARIPILRCAFSSALGAMKNLGKRAMIKMISLAASMLVLVAISVQASAGTAAAGARHGAHASANPTAMHAYDAVAPATAEPNAHRYHGGPKVND